MLIDTSTATLPPANAAEPALTSTPPTAGRLRHSSTPHSLPSHTAASVQLATPRPFCCEAEDVWCGGRRLAGWEERVMRARGERKWRRLQKIALVNAAVASTADSAIAVIGGGKRNQNCRIPIEGKNEDQEDDCALLPSYTAAAPSAKQQSARKPAINLPTPHPMINNNNPNNKKSDLNSGIETDVTTTTDTAIVNAERTVNNTEAGVTDNNSNNNLELDKKQNVRLVSSICYDNDDESCYADDDNVFIDDEMIQEGKDEFTRRTEEITSKGKCCYIRRWSSYDGMNHHSLPYDMTSFRNLPVAASLHPYAKFLRPPQEDKVGRIDAASSPLSTDHVPLSITKSPQLTNNDRKCGKNSTESCHVDSCHQDDDDACSLNNLELPPLLSPSIHNCAKSKADMTKIPDYYRAENGRSCASDGGCISSYLNSAARRRACGSSDKCLSAAPPGCSNGRQQIDSSQELSTPCYANNLRTTPIALSDNDMNNLQRRLNTNHLLVKEQTNSQHSPRMKSCGREFTAAAESSRRRREQGIFQSPFGLTGVTLLLCLVTTLMGGGVTGSLVTTSPPNTNGVLPRVCKANININHKTAASQLKQWQNCSVLEGSLQINSALKDYEKALDEPPFSFPNLVEITDYLLLFRANQIGNLTAILPKLAVIRGHRLVHNSALAVYQMKNMKTLGLKSLTSIMRGGVRIEKNPSLCYVKETIDWKSIVLDKVVIDNEHISIEENMSPEACLESCPDKCDGKCWDPTHCQIRKDKCSSGGGGNCYRDSDGELQAPCSTECLGGCSHPDSRVSPEHCFSCLNVWYTSNNVSVCVDKCPEDFLSYKDWKCISEEECMSLRNPEYGREEEEFYKIHIISEHTKQCVNQCPANYEAKNSTGRWECIKCKNCPRWCDGGVINSREEAERYKHCTHIHGNVEIRVSESDISPVLEKTMKDIKIIEGSFKVSRSFALVSLYFFKSLEEIQNVERNEFSITVMENDNLQKLFPRAVKVKNGKAFIHYNQKLCMEEIKEFLKNGNMSKPSVFDVSDVTNGNKAACSKDELDFNITHVYGRFALFNMSDYRRNLADSKDEDLNSLIGYEIFYREITEEQYEAQSVSKYEGLDACGSNVWNVIDMRPNKAGYETSGRTQNNVANWYTKPEIGQLRDLKPYTTYAVYANTLMVPHLATKASGAQSPVKYFRTDSEPPEEVDKLKVHEKTESSLSLRWRPPAKAHGIIDHYEVQVELIQMTNTKLKNYCVNKIQKDSTEEKPEEPKNKKPPKQPVVPGGRRNDSTCPACDCSRESSDSNPIPDRGEEHIDEQQFYNDLINKIFTIPSLPALDQGMRRKRSIDNASGSKNSFVRNGDDNKSANDMIVFRKINGIPTRTVWKNETKLVNGTNLYQTVHIIVKGNEVKIENLKHFSYYQIKVMACQKEKNVTFGGKTTRQKDCSSWTIEEAKTLPKPGADDIIMDNDEIDIYMANETTGETFMRWKPPADPNQMIIHYTVRTTKTLSDDSANFERCIPLSAIEQLDNGWVQTKLTREGEIWVSLRAQSMYRPGKWTKWQWAMVNSDSGHTTWIIVLVVLGVAALLLLLGVLVWRQRRANIKGNKQWNLISANPDYLDTTFVYQIDDWEVSRELISRGEELGSGSFGVCYRGVYNHAEKGPVPVAIKSVPDHATFRQRVEFLNEASVMKDISTEYVVRLIGVVSQGQPTLVLMELMENGDLRRYLRGLRPDVRDESVEPPTLQRILQMALEIADGMAYLSVRKYVHRDLAARNCMVSSDLIVKIGDFGMAQDVYEKEYYRTEGRRPLPVRWMAPESLRDGRFTSKSDVWSYGVVLWEMATLAEQPYQGWGNDEVVSYVKDGSIMPRPDNCPDRLYDMMRDCWQRNADQRPSFLDLCERLLTAGNAHYQSNSFYLSSQGEEAVANQRAHRNQEDSAISHNTTPLTTNGGAHTDNNGSALPTTTSTTAVSTATTTNGGGSSSKSPLHNSNGSNGGGGSNGSNGSGPTITFRSPTHISFSALRGGSVGGGGRGSESGTTSKTAAAVANGLGMINRLRNKSGSSSGDAA